MSTIRGTRFGHYEVAALIGVGGMGEVYRAADTTLKRDVALKMLPESFVTDATRLARLQREAELLASLNHPNVAQIYGLERSDGRTALVMELIDGPTLAERIAEGPLPQSEALEVARQIAAALEAAHERGIVHRDLKPANIKLKADGTVKVLDFGIAKALDPPATSGPQAAVTIPAMTEVGVVLGTAAYMAPEQARGKPVDRRADVWSFGCVLYEMLTGKAAFLGNDVAETLARVLERDADMSCLPAGLAPGVRGTLELCLQKDAKKRLRDIGDARLALEGGFASVAPGDVRHRPPLWRRALPFAAVTAGALAAGAYLTTGIRPVQPAAEPSPLPVTRFVVTPPISAPLANLGGLDVVISPDAKRLAYFARSPEGGAALYVRELDGLEARSIPGTEVRNPTGGTMNPFFAPDGMSIGFFSPERGVLRVGIDGASPPLKMLDPPEPIFLGAVWDADDTIVFSAGRTLARASAGGGGPPEVLLTLSGTATAVAPALLPGGRAVLFGLIDNDLERVAVLDLETGQQKILIEGGQNAVYSATGHIVFARGTTLMAVPFNAMELAVTGEPVALVRDVRHPTTQSAADFALSESGTLIYVPSGGEGARSTVVWVDRSGQVVGRAIGEPVENPRDPALSPDGTRLALTIGPPSDGDVWSYDLRGRPPIRLAVADDDRSPVWSPDATQVLFTILSRGDADLYVSPADGSVVTPRPLRTQRVSAFVRVWSPAGELFMIRPSFATNDITVMPAAAAGETRDVVATEFWDVDPALSPNGRWLAYSSNRTGQFEVWVRGYPDGVVVRISNDWGIEPRWSADGRELFYLRGNAMMAVAVETDGEFSFAAPVQLFNRPYFVTAEPSVNSYDVAGDGRFLMIERAAGGSENGGLASIVVVENWFEELKRRVPTN